MPHCFFRTFLLFIMISGLLEVGCQSDDEEEVLTLAQQLTGQWDLNALDANIQLDGEDYVVYLSQLAELFDLSPSEAALGLIFLEAQISQEVLDRELRLHMLNDNLFMFKQAEGNSLHGVWQLSDDEQAIQLTSEAGEILQFLLVSFDESEMVLRLEEHSDAPFLVPNIPQQLTLQLEMEWVKVGLDSE